MTRRRWIADEFSDERAFLTGAHAAHLSRTLRARVGQEFEVACGDRVRRAIVTSVSEDRVEFTLGEEVAASAVVPITLLLAIFKFDRMEWAIEKCTELNVTTIIPVIARRTEKHLAVAAAKRVERWRRIAHEASEQSRRASPPEIRQPLMLKDALELSREFQPRSLLAQNIELREGQPRSRGPQRAPVLRSLGWGRGGIGFSPGRQPWVERKIEPSPVGTAQDATDGSMADPDTSSEFRRDSTDQRLVLAETEREAALGDILRAGEVKSLALAIGPEGGWTVEELQAFERSRWVAASLGETILRAETAAIAALTIARAEV